MKHQRWTPEEIAFLEDYWTDFKSPEARQMFLAKLGKVSGHKRSYGCCAAKAGKMGILKKETISLPTVSELALEFGVSDTAVRNLINRFPERFPVDHRNHATFVPEETQQKLREWYKLPPAKELVQTITKNEAADRLGMVPLALNRLIRFGALRALKVGAQYRVYEHSVQEVIELRKRYGTYWLAAIKDRLTPEYHRFCASQEERMRQKRRSA